jgi:uncharacterized damage-inducible protein DinB
VRGVLVELIYGAHAHANPLVCVDVSPEAAGQRPPGFSHSIWQLVWHMSYWMDYELKRIAGQPAPYPEHAALSWPDVRPARSEDWPCEVERFTERLGRLAQLAALPAGERARPIAPLHDSEARHASSFEAVLWQTLVHNSYHLGQVVQVRQAIGAWPPPSGSDTW